MNVLVDGGVCGVFDRFWDLGSGSMHTHDTLIENCTFVNQNVDPASQNFHGYGVAVQTMSNTVVRNCIFQDDERGAVFKQTTPIGGNPATTDITIENTIYYNCPELIVVDNGTDCQTIVHTNAIFNVDPQLQTYQDYPYCSPWGGLGWHGRPFESPVTLNDVAWPLVGNNIQREGNAAVDGIDSDAMILWTNTTQIGPTSSGIWGSPATDETQVYIPVDQYNVEEYTFLSININDGMLNYGVYLDDWCNGAPCVSENMVFSGDVLGNVYGIDKSNGLIIWKTPVGGAVNDCVTLHNNKIYAKGDGVGVKCLNAETGTSLWTNAHGDATTWSGNGPSMNADGSVLYYKVNSGSIRAVDTSDGATLWTFTEGESGNGMTDPIIDDAGNVYCGLNGLSGATEHVVLKLNSSGETEWSYNFGENAWRGGYCLSVDNQTLYVSSQLGLRALNTDDGTLKWTSPDIDVTSGGCAVSQDGIVVGVHLKEGTTSAFAVQDTGTSGTLLWSIPIDTGNGSLSWPCILPNGDVVVATDGGTIVRIGVPEPSLIGCILLGCILMLRRKA
jgi:outer membrane protein assembly factor BamB